jgi:hypothetical protein
MDIRLNIHRDPEEVLWEYAEQTNTSNMQSTCALKTNRISSSMRFYLLKKRFLKRTSAVNVNISNGLIHEEYVI